MVQLILEGVFIGAEALIREKLEIGDGTVIGMGAVVTMSKQTNMVAVGIPATMPSREKCGGGWLGDGSKYRKQLVLQISPDKKTINSCNLLPLLRLWLLDSEKT